MTDLVGNALSTRRSSAGSGRPSGPASARRSSHSSNTGSDPCRLSSDWRASSDRRIDPLDRDASYLHDVHRPSSLMNGNNGVPVHVQIDDVNLLPSRWWLAASAFPMAAGTLGPVASAFSICALVRPWRQEIVPGTTIENAPFISDPVWLTTINAVQLVVAIGANLFLLLNMTRRIRFAVAQPVTMVGWYISSFTLIALTCTAAGPLRKGTDDSILVWSQAFYYAIYSAILYMIVASLMIVTFYGAWTGHYAKDFQLTNSQRTLMLQTIMFLVYLEVGALIFSTIEGWAFLDAVYWADVTLFTVGFGDFAAKTTLGRALLFPYALIGIISLGLVIGSIRNLALDRGSHRLDARMTEKNRLKFLHRMAKKGNDDILQPIQEHDGSGGSEDEHPISRRNSALSGLSRASHASHATNATRMRRNARGLTELERREEEFNIMRKIQHDAARKRRWVAVATSGGTWIALWLIGAYIFMAAEKHYQNWDYFGGFYLAFVSLTTMGYGDMTPISNAGKSFFVFWSLMALPTMTILISDMGDTIVKFVSDTTDAIGRITILPGERGIKRDIKATIRALTCGAIFMDLDIEDVPPGLLGAAQALNESPEEEEEEEEEEAEEAEEAVDEVDPPNGENADDDGDDGRDGDEDEDEDEDGDAAEEDDARRGSSSNTAQTADGAASDEKGGTPSDAGQLNEKAVDGAVDGEAAAPVDAQSLPNRRMSAGSLSVTGRLLRSGTSVSLNSTGTGGTSGTVGTVGTVGTGGHGSAQRRRHWHGHDARGSSHRHQHPPTVVPLGASASAAVSTPRVDLPQSLPSTRAAYHALLLDEIANVTQHLRHKPPRKYTFAEWAWFLKLIGEDERRADTHRRAAVTKAERARLGDDDADLDTPQAWSWVGARSPLMGSQEEAEWILDLLLRRLQAELRAEVRAGGTAIEYGAAPTSSPIGEGPADFVRRPALPIQEEPL